MYLLLHCEEATSFPFTCTSSKPVPLAKMQRPPVASWASCAVHSDLEVGFERGKMIGGASFWFIAESTSLVKRPPTAERPGEVIEEVL